MAVGHRTPSRLNTRRGFFVLRDALALDRDRHCGEIFATALVVAGEAGGDRVVLRLVEGVAPRSTRIVEDHDAVSDADSHHS